MSQGWNYLRIVTEAWIEAQDSTTLREVAGVLRGEVNNADTVGDALDLVERAAHCEVAAEVAEAAERNREGGQA